MKKILHWTMLFVLAMLGNLAFASTTGTAVLYGNGAAKADTDLTIQDMLTYAIQDEYLARGEYVAIMAKFGTIRPFSNIMEAEKTHISWLEQAFKTYKIAIPKDESASFIVVPKTVTEAYEAGVQAEIDNIDMYDRFLAQPVIQDSKYADLKTLFTNLRNASENHLRAFKNQLGR
ncbi:DUF2202 domain-containing protein [Gracilinema caldarium]|uniref:ferritin-like domain-containing protein n=1 Tax=Gracilinema caldarium TaxID=215591 RepID=UPI0026F1E13C|nr:DUF2202 domain-containing protein [Gracilinema caldarium]